MRTTATVMKATVMKAMGIPIAMSTQNRIPEPFVQSHWTSGIDQAHGGERQRLQRGSDTAFGSEGSDQQHRKDHFAGSYRALHCGRGGMW